MFTPWPIGFVSTPYKETSDVPKGLGASHEAAGVITILPDFELGLTDIEGFSHLIVLWEFDPSQHFELLGTPILDIKPYLSSIPAASLRRGWLAEAEARANGNATVS